MAQRYSDWSSVYTSCAALRCGGRGGGSGGGQWRGGWPWIVDTETRFMAMDGENCAMYPLSGGCMLAARGSLRSVVACVCEGLNLPGHGCSQPDV